MTQSLQYSFHVFQSLTVTSKSTTVWFRFFCFHRYLKMKILVWQWCCMPKTPECSPGYSGILCGNYDGPHLTWSRLPLPLSAGIKSMLASGPLCVLKQGLLLPWILTHRLGCLGIVLWGYTYSIFSCAGMIGISYIPRFLHSSLGISLRAKRLPTEPFPSWVC